MSPARVAVVTGASRGIGAATARRLAYDGYRVVAAARSTAELQRLAAENGRMVPRHADLLVDADIERVALSADAEGDLHVWVNNAAALARVPFADLDRDMWREIMQVDLDAVFLGCRLAFQRMAARGGGVIVNIASLSGVQNVEKFPGLAAYNVAKAGVIALSEAVALEGREHGVRSVCLSPGGVDTEMMRTANPALRASATPDDVAAIISWLVTPEAALLSGTNIPIFSNA
ncbi:MAG: SDR family oxidoreductase [Candidatus Dormibacteraeota bacterium]|nr:SDR family oxidoreductase [Candidatus Dormibacteraeota bacterium]